ncbi:hypothetical protein ARMGADRAFT_1133026 [Armillaria gallica]|uniref:Uncharacterized protein n=1 Tax=Armillaria gallica TaxID=47427 RepID=A0A2H3CMJ4_ARMGA|nr:hypothetical protein ARMGADRAFT_1133026 [Armillaria gallica]
MISPVQTSRPTSPEQPNHDEKAGKVPAMSASVEVIGFCDDGGYLSEQLPIELDDNDERVGKGFSLRHSTDADDPQISEQISEKIPMDVAVPGYPDPWHPDPPDADMTLVTCNIRGYSICFGICLIPHLQNGHPGVLEVEDLGSGVGFTLGGHPDP